MKPYRQIIFGVFICAVHGLLSLFLFLAVAAGVEPNLVLGVLLFFLTLPLSLVAVFILMLGGSSGIWVFVLIGLNSALWAGLACRFGPRRKLDARLCVACGYDLRGTTTDRCPECGISLESIQTALLSKRPTEETPEDVLALLMDESGCHGKSGD